MISKIDKNSKRRKIHLRIRKNITGNTAKPRLNVYRSLNHIYTQLIDDTQGITLVACSTMEKDVAAKISGKNKVESAKIVGELVAKKAIEAGVSEVVFDRGGYLYTGRIQAVAEGAREAGLKF